MQVPYVVGNTMTCNDFYETQGRLDGAFCDFSNAEKLGFIQRAHDEVIFSSKMIGNQVNFSTTSKILKWKLRYFWQCAIEPEFPVL